ncbi:MAG: putative baseplate assembly protein [Kineosporiaceae bacterium]
MTLPAPTLDDRRFQDLVDEAKRLIPRYCPQWTDHNVSDPGVAILELMAWMTEQTLYRLNRVPDRLYVKFLELVGIELMSAAPARTQLVFELSAPPEEPVRIPAATQVATDSEDPVVFMTDAELTLGSPALTECLTRTAGGRFTSQLAELQVDGGRVTALPGDDGTRPAPGAALYLGFAASLASHLVRISAVGSAAGAGIDPQRPPLQWQAWDGSAWQPVRVLTDTTAGFTEAGDVVLLVGPRHQPLAPTQQSSGWWLRCRLMPAAPGASSYDVSPMLADVQVSVLGGAVPARHAEPVPAEFLGLSDGEPGQVFQVRRAPVLARSAAEHVRVLLPRRGPDAEQDWQDWSEVHDFAEVGADDRVYTWSGATGEIRFGPRVQRRRVATPGGDAPVDGARQHGAVPPIDAQVWVSGYRVGGGARGNVGARTLTVARSAIASLSRVYNLDPAVGGVDAETVDNAKLRGPLELRSVRRAVTKDDFERLALGATRQVARALAVPDPARPGVVQLLLVPAVRVEPRALTLDHLELPEELSSAVADHLEGHRLLTTTVAIGRPTYLGVSVAALVRAQPGLRRETVKEAAEAALYRHVNPVTGGLDGQGWPFGRPLNIGEVYSVLNAVPEVAGIDQVTLFTADLARPAGPGRVSQTPEGNVVQPEPHGLLASCDHLVEVIA